MFIIPLSHLTPLFILILFLFLILHPHPMSTEQKRFPIYWTSSPPPLDTLCLRTALGDRNGPRTKKKKRGSIIAKQLRFPFS
jgi:hypothetical protein